MGLYAIYPLLVIDENKSLLIDEEGVSCPPPFSANSPLPSSLTSSLPNYIIPPKEYKDTKLLNMCHSYFLIKISSISPINSSCDP